MRPSILSLVISIFLFSCINGGIDLPTSFTDTRAKFVSSKRISFQTKIDAETLTQEQGFSLSGSFDSRQRRATAYIISTQEELNAFNQTVSLHERVILDNLQIYTYFFMRAPSCPEFFEYVSHSYEEGTLTIVLNHFTVRRACPLIMVETYYVFRARKR
jgi:hypothetical protein